MVSSWRNRDSREPTSTGEGERLWYRSDRQRILFSDTMPPEATFRVIPERRAMTDTALRNPVQELPDIQEWDEPITGLQLRELIQILQVLERRFAGQGVEVTGDESIRYDRKDLRRAVAPDILFVKGAPPRIRKSFCPWREAGTPAWVLEVLSESTAKRDLEDKPLVYHRLKVAEMFHFDPEGMEMEPVLKGYRWAEQGYEPIEPDGRRVPSAELGLVLEAEPYVEDKVRYWRLRFIDPETGLWLPTTEELLDLKNQALLEKDRSLQEKERSLEEKDRSLQEKERSLQEKDRIIQELPRRLGEE